jgi:hypothetical protein
VLVLAGSAEEPLATIQTVEPDVIRLSEANLPLARDEGVPVPRRWA